jgi:anti-sigma regulatory factor (Ser/Thr protein kinase)
MVLDPPGGGTVAPDGDDPHLEAVSVQGVGAVLVLDVRGELAEVAESAYLSVLLGIAEEPAAVVCDLSGVTGPVDPESVDLLASLGVEVEQWPGVPVAVVCPDPPLRNALGARPDCRYLMVERERQPLLDRLLARRPPPVVRMSLEPNPRSASAARRVVTKACDRWGMSSVSASATLVVSELVTNALPHAGGDVGLSVARSGERLRVAVRDASSERPQPQPVEPSRPRGRGLLLVAALADAWGVLPAGDGGKVVWAVLHA